MPTTRRDHRSQLTDPAHIADAFASGFEVQDFEDWLRVVCWVDMIESGDGDGVEAERRKAAAIVIPRSSVGGLIRALRDSAGHRKEAGSH